MVGVEADADLLAECVVVVRGHQREDLAAAFQAQRVQDVGAAEGLVQDFGLDRTGIVVDDVVGAQQDVDGAAAVATGTAFAAFDRGVGDQRAEFHVHAVVVTDRAGEQHALADEVGDEAVGRAVVQVVRRVPLLDAAVVHEADFVGDGEGLVLVVGDHDRGRPLALEDFPDFDREPLAQADVEVGEGLVEQDQRRSRGQCAGQGDALLLAAGQLVRVLVAMPGQADGGEQLADAQVVVLGLAAVEAEADVLFDGEMGKQRIVLENHADPAFFRGDAAAGAADRLAVQADFAAGDFLEAGDAAQQGRLAATGGAEQAGDLAGRQTEIDAVDDGVAAVALDHAIQFELCHGARL